MISTNVRKINDQLSWHNGAMIKSNNPAFFAHYSKQSHPCKSSEADQRTTGITTRAEYVYTMRGEMHDFRNK